MSSQRYTRWRTADDEFDEDLGENGELTETRDQEETESRRAFTLMTPSRESTGAYKNFLSRKFIFVTALLCIILLLGGAFMGFYLGWSYHLERPIYQTTTQKSSVPPEVESTPVPPTTCDHSDTFEDIAAMSIKLMKRLSIYDIKKHVNKLMRSNPTDIGSYIKLTLQKHGYRVQPLVYSVSTSYHLRDDPSTVSILYKNGTNFRISSSFRTDSQNRSFVSFNGYSANGTFSGPIVYGHFATIKDLKTVEADTITLNNSILLVRQGKLHPSIQVRNAEKYGVKAVILYPDPEDFGRKPNDTSSQDGRFLPEDGVITQNLRLKTGDPATVGYTSEKYVYRLPPNKFSDIPTIPVLSISASEAKNLFSILHGPPAPATWKGALTSTNTLGGSFKPDLNITSIIVSVLCNVGLADIKSIHASLPAKDVTKVIHVGTHFDESKDRIPTSVVGVAAWLSFAGVLKEVFPNGTNRMVLFSAFPGTRGDYSGGGEYAELMSNWLHTTALAYVDFDEILSGSGFLEVRASPLMKKVVKESYHHVEWANKSNFSVLQGLLEAKKQMAEDPNLQRIEVDEIKEASMCGECANFYAMNGIPTLNLKAVDVKQRDFYLKNSQYDELKTGIQLLDPDLEWTHMITSLLSISSVILSNARLPPVYFEYFASHLKNEWILFTYEQKDFISTYKGDLHGLINAINGELDIVRTVFDSLDLSYMEESTTSDVNSFRKHEENLLKFIMVSRHFLRPGYLPSPLKGSSLITFGPDVENPCETVSFPMARKVIYDIGQNASTWNDFEIELSLILSAVNSLHTKMGSHR